MFDSVIVVGKISFWFKTATMSHLFVFLFLFLFFYGIVLSFFSMSPLI